MKGFQVRRKAGWDTHGLPVESKLKKQLKMTGKQDIENTVSRNLTKSAVNPYLHMKAFGEKCPEEWDIW